jgi:hypothetical protein
MRRIEHATVIPLDLHDYQVRTARQPTHVRRFIRPMRAGSEQHTWDINRYRRPTQILLPLRPQAHDRADTPMECEGDASDEKGSPEALVANHARDGSE